MAKIVVLGTSHIASESVKAIESAAEENKPDIIAVELDAQRLNALLNKERRGIRMSDIFRVGLGGYFFAQIGGFVQRRLGSVVGVEPGAEMLAAVRYAQVKGIRLALIDQNVTITLRKFSAAFGWKEKLNFLVDIVNGLLRPRMEIKRYGLDKLDLRKVPEKRLINQMLMHIKARYPGLHRVLIEERNDIMIARLKRLAEDNPDATILAVVGAGHEAALKKGVLDNG